MSTMLFESADTAFHTPIRYSGVDTPILPAKLDCGADISVINAYALSLLLREQLSTIKKYVVSDHNEFTVSSLGIESVAYLCRINNFLIGDTLWNTLYVAIPGNDAIKNIRGKKVYVPKILLGMDVLKCCSGTLDFNGEIQDSGSLLLEVKDQTIQKQYVETALFSDSPEIFASAVNVDDIEAKRISKE